MFVLVAYDVSTVDAAGRRRLARVARACKDYGVRVQKSIFECELGAKEWVRLRERLFSEFQESEDSLRFYFLDDHAISRTEHHGVGKPLDLKEPIIL